MSEVTVELEVVKTITVEVNTGAPGATGATGATGAAGVGVPSGGTANQVLEKIDSTDHNTQWADDDVDGIGEDESAKDATGGGTVTLDVSLNNVFNITTDDTAFTIATSNAPASGESRGVTLYLSFTGAIPTITWPTLKNTAPDISGATASTGFAVIEMLYVRGSWWAWLVEAI